MKKLKAELAAKSHCIDTLDRRLFFSYDVFSKDNKYGITIDAHALQDNRRNVAESLKLVYLCMIKYTEIADIIGVEHEKPLSIKELEAWFILKPCEAAQALQYITDQLADKTDKKKADLSPRES